MISWQSASIDQVYWWCAGSVTVVCRQCDCGVLAVCQVLIGGVFQNVTVISWQYCIYVGGVLVFVVSIAP